MKAHLQPMAGFKEISLLMDLISEPKKFKNIIKELKEMHDKINESITIAATIEKADGYLSDAKAEFSASRAATTSEREKLLKYKETILTTLRKKEDTFYANEKEVNDKQEAFAKTLNILQEGLDVKAIELTNREKEVIVKSDMLENKKNTLTELQEELSRKSKLMKETAANLG